MRLAGKFACEISFLTTFFIIPEKWDGSVPHVTTQPDLAGFSRCFRGTTDLIPCVTVLWQPTKNHYAMSII
jgi:hypothetical protein